VGTFPFDLGALRGVVKTNGSAPLVFHSGTLTELRLNGDLDQTGGSRSVAR